MGQVTELQPILKLYGVESILPLCRRRESLGPD